MTRINLIRCLVAIINSRSCLLQINSKLCKIILYVINKCTDFIAGFCIYLRFRGQVNILRNESVQTRRQRSRFQRKLRDGILLLLCSCCCEETSCCFKMSDKEKKSEKDGGGWRKTFLSGLASGASKKEDKEKVTKFLFWELHL